MPAFIDLTGQRFGKLTVVERAGKAHTSVLWSCRCDCGNIVQVPSTSLRKGATKSCGCTQYRWLSEQKPSMTHGGARVGKKERLYRVWCAMIERCENPNNIHYHLYGGRGISVCPEWRRDYAAFREWAMTSGYDPFAPRGKCTIDRIDNNSLYAPYNCRWVDNKIQCSNKRTRGEA